jgi:hypothetical protein
MLIVSTKYKVMAYTIMMVACMSVNELFNNSVTEAQTDKADKPDDFADQDPDLVTSLDRQRAEQKAKGQRRQAKESAH